MTFETHCIMDLEKFGEEFPYVHKWLDYFAGRQPHGMKHRKFRHHQKGVEFIRGKYGDKAAAAAELHILADLSDEFLEMKIVPYIPKNQTAYETAGFY